MSNPENRPDAPAPDTADIEAAGPETDDPDAGPTMTAPPEDRPDAGASVLDRDGRADDADAADADAGMD